MPCLTRSHPESRRSVVSYRQPSRRTPSSTRLLQEAVPPPRRVRIPSHVLDLLVGFGNQKASGICTGTPVRIRGVTVGNVIQVNLSLKSIEAVVEVEDCKIIIPQNSLVEVNQSGLLMETLINITPTDPIPTPSAGPLDPECVKEGQIVCDRQTMKGYQGISLDALVGIFTRLGREVEEIGVDDSYSLAERVFSVIEEAKPLLTKSGEFIHYDT